MQSKALNRIFELLLVFVFCLFCLPASAQNARLPHDVTYGRLPLTFEANRGQTSPQAKFLARGRGYVAHLTTEGMVLSLRSKQGPRPTSKASAASPTSGANTVEIRLQGANANSAVIGEQLQPGVVNYFIGRDPANWRTRIPTYARVRYKNVYPGIDLVYHGNHQELEYDFELQPGSRPEQIAFEIRGADGASLDGRGNLIINAKGSAVQVQCPVVYQLRNGRQIPVKGAYVMKDHTHLGFTVAQYDRSQPLVIDPVIAYATYLGGSGVDVAGGMAADSAGNVYLTGYTNSDDFPSGTSGLQGNSNHIFVSKLDASGSNLLYTDFIGGNGEDYGVGLVLDSSSGVFVTGSTTSSNFPVLNGYQQSQPGPYAGFLTHLSQDGSSLLYSTYLGGDTFDQPTSIAINQSGQVYVAGFTMSQNFPTANALQGSVSPNQGNVYGYYGFITKFSEDGSSLVYSTYLAGNSNQSQTCGTSTCWPQPYSVVSTISVDANDNLYAAGTTNTYNFPTTSGSYLANNNTDGNSYISYVTKLTSAGALGYSTYFYGSSGSPVSIMSIAVDNTGSAYVTGNAISDGTFPITTTSICDPGAPGVDCSYGFATKFDSTGSTLLYSTFLGPFNYANPQTILLDSQSNAYILANTSSPIYQTVNPVEGYMSGLDILLVEINSDATAQLFSTYLGGSGDEMPSGMALDSEENVYVAGSTGSSDFPVTQAAFQTQYAGNDDTFLAKIFTGTSPLITLSSTALQFSSTAVGSQSQAINLQLQNLSAMPLTIASLSISSDFSQTNTCGSTVAPYAACTFAVTFAPTTFGNRTGSLTIRDNATGAPHVISLQGNGTGSTASLSATTLIFSTTALGLTSAAQTVTLGNQGNSNLSIASISTTGDFAQTNNCGNILAVNSSCTLTVTFAPILSGTRTGSVFLNDSAIGGNQVIHLQGTGVTSTIALSSSTVTFSSTAVGASSAAKTVTVTNQGSSTLTIGGLQTAGDFSQTNNCTSSLSARSSCTIQVVFSPKASGTRSGLLQINDSAAGSPQAVALSGAGSDFGINGASSTATVNSGSTGTYTLQISSVGSAFSNTVSLACSHVPAQATCKLSPDSAMPGSKGASVTVTIATNGSSSSSSAAAQFHNLPVMYAAWIQFQGLGLFGIAVVGARFHRKKWLAALGLVLVFLLLCLAVGCAGGTGIAQQTQNTAPGTYTVLVTGTSGTLKHSVSLTLVVQ